MDELRRSARISKLDRKTNEYIRGKMNEQDTILNNPKTFGMVMSREWTQRDYQKTRLIGNLKEGKKRCRPRRTWKDGI
jgi:hypothetical protein